MPSSFPWKLKPQFVKVEIDDVTSFEVPLYPSQLVDEAILWAQLKKDKAPTVDAAKQYVVFALRHRRVIDDQVSDEDLSKNLTVDLVNRLFVLFFYGSAGQPEIVELEEEVTAKKKPTGTKSSGSSSSTTPTSKSSAQKTLAAAQ